MDKEDERRRDAKLPSEIKNTIKQANRKSKTFTRAGYGGVF